MRTIKFIVDGQNIKRDLTCDFSKIVKGSKGYLKCNFSFSAEWSGCKIAASFWSFGKEIDAALLENGECQIPDSVTDFRKFGISLIGVRGGYRITTNKVWVEQEG